MQSFEMGISINPIGERRKLNHSEMELEIQDHIANKGCVRDGHQGRCVPESRKLHCHKQKQMKDRNMMSIPRKTK